MSRIKKFIATLLDRIKTVLLVLHFSKLKVFYQILTIILVMIIFITIQGITSIYIVNTLQKKTQEISGASFNKLKENYEVIIQLERIRSDYLGKMANNPPNLINIGETIDKVQYLGGIPKKTKEMICKHLDEINQLMNEPQDTENYNKFKMCLLLIARELEGANSSILEETKNTVIYSNKYSNDSKIYTMVFGLLSVFLATLIGILIANSISRPLKTMVSASKSLAIGNLSSNLEVLGCPEVTEALEELNQATYSLRILVKGINQQSDVLFIASEELKEGITDTGHSATQVAQAMEQLAKASSEQAVQINHAVDTIRLLSELVRKVSSDTEKIAAVSKNVANSAQVGQRASNDVAEEINSLFNFTKEVAVVINELSETSGEINEITGVIEGIAEQTTLLALNAAIEAARAGEQGRGFSVVAEETGKLADQSKQAARLIADLIAQMKVSTDHAVHVMQEGISRAEAGKNKASEATVAFEGIFETLTKSLAQVDEVAESARMMAKRNEDVIGAISQIAAISEQSMASTEEVSATTEEQSAAVQEITSLAENLSGIAAHLKDTVAVFEVGEEK